MARARARTCPAASGCEWRARRRSPVARPRACQRSRRWKFERAELELIERLVRHDRTAVSSAVLAIAGIGAGGARRRAVLARVGEAAGWAQAEGAITPERGAQIARHVSRALQRGNARLAA